MDHELSQDRLREYQGKISDWMGRQGLLFQLRHAGSLHKSSLFRQLGVFVVRLLILALIIGGLSFFALRHHLKGAGHGEKMQGLITDALGGVESEKKGFARKGGMLKFKDFSLTGGPDSFFYEAKFRDFEAPISILEGIRSAWQPDEVSIVRASIELKAGGKEEEMTQAYANLLSTLDGDSIRAINVNDFSCRWGYSKLTFGEIKNAALSAKLQDGVWTVELIGGTFSQNWLKDFRINSGVLKISEGGIKVETLELTKGDCLLNLAGEVAGSPGNPAFDLAGTFEHLDLVDVIDLPNVEIDEYIWGQVSGELEITGSTNRSVQIAGSAKIDEGQTFALREQFDVLRAISLIDTDRSYRRIDFSTGSFDFVSREGGLKVSGIELVAENLKVKGGFETTLPSQKEAADYLGITLTDDFASDVNGAFKVDYTDSSAAQLLEDERMSLRDAAEGTSEDDKFLREVVGRVEDQASQAGGGAVSKTIESLQLQLEMKVHRFAGQIEISVPEDAFSDESPLVEKYPVNEEGWRPIVFELGATFKNLTHLIQREILDTAKGR